MFEKSHPPSTDDLILSTSKQSIQTLATTIGGRRCEESAVSYLTDLTMAFMFKVCQDTQLLKGHVGGLNDTSVEDVLNGLTNFKIKAPELNRYMCRIPPIFPPINLPLFPVDISRQKTRKEFEFTEEEAHFRRINDIPDFLPPIWPQKCKSKVERDDASLKSSAECLTNQKLKCFICPIKTTVTNQSFDELPDCEIDTKMLPSFSSWKPSSPDFIVRNPKNNVPILPNKNVAKLDKTDITANEYVQVATSANNAGYQHVLEEGELESDDDGTNKQCGPLSPTENVAKKQKSVDAKMYKNIQAGTSTAAMNQEVMDFKVSKMKREPTKRKSEYLNENVKKPKTEALISYNECSTSVSSSPQEKSTPPYQFVSSLCYDYKVPKNGYDSTAASKVKPGQHLSSQSSSSSAGLSNSSLLEKCNKDYYSSSLPKSKPYYSLPPAATTKCQMKNKKSTKSATLNPRPVTGGKTIKMTPLRHHQPSKKRKPQSRSNGFPKCELLADKGIKMVIRLPKKV